MSQKMRWVDHGAKRRPAEKEREAKQSEMKRIWRRPTNQTARYFNYSPFLCLTYERSNETKQSQQSNVVGMKWKAAEFISKTHGSNGGIVISRNTTDTRITLYFLDLHGLRASCDSYDMLVHLCPLQSIRNDGNGQMPFHIHFRCD